MVKTNKKSLIAMIAMVVLLIASIAMGITGAWFTDKGDTGAGSDFTFGTVTLGNITEDLAVENSVETTLDKLMPGSTISGNLSIEYTGNAKAYIRYKLVVTGDGANYVTLALTGADSDGWVYTTSDDCADDIAISGSVATTTLNAAQGKSINVKFEVQALQQANTTGVNTAAGAWSGVSMEA